MTISAVPFALQNVPINADVVRQAVSSLIPNGGGIVQTGDLAVTQLGTPAMGVQVGVGRAWIDGTNLAHLSSQGYGKQGMYFVLNDAAYNVTISTSNATNPRIDVIYAAVPDTAYAGSSNTPVIAVATGTPTAGATYPANAPSVPNNAIKLAWVYVGAGVTSITTSNITQLVNIGTIGTAPLGLMWYAAFSVDPGGIGTTLTVINNCPSFTFKGGRKYRVGWVAEYSVSSTDTHGEICIQQAPVGDPASSTANLTRYNRHTIEAGTAGITKFFNHAFIHTPVTDSTVQVKFTLQQVAGTGTIALSGLAVARPMEFFIEDLGAQF